MKKFYILILMALVAMPLSAKKKKEYPRAEIMVSYSYYEKFLRGGTEVAERNNEYILLSNATQSKFYPPVTEYLDSLNSTPSGRKQYEQMLSAVMTEVVRTGNYDLVPHRKGDIYVFKNRTDCTVDVYELMGLTESGCYTEPLAEMQWVIGDSMKTVLGYECMIAHADYHGRQWTVWFTPEVPLQEGPWKLCGLPGLILEASESSGQHAFTATGLEVSTKDMRPVYSPEQYDRVDRKELLRHKKVVRSNQGALSSTIIESYAGNGSHAKARNPIGKVETDVDFLETDYRE